MIKIEKTRKEKIEEIGKRLREKDIEKNGNKYIGVWGYYRDCAERLLDEYEKNLKKK